MICPRCDNPSFQDGPEFPAFQHCPCGLSRYAAHKRYVGGENRRESKPFYTSFSLVEMHSWSMEFYPLSNVMTLSFDGKEMDLLLDWKITKDRINTIRLLKE